MSNKNNLKDFIEKAIEVHDGKYNYSKVKYPKSDLKVKIMCPIHGVFLQNPNIHLSGKGCMYCLLENKNMN